MSNLQLQCVVYGEIVERRKKTNIDLCRVISKDNSILE